MECAIVHNFRTNRVKGEVITYESHHLKSVEFLRPFLVLTDKYLRRLLIRSKCCIQGIDMFFGQLDVVLNVFQLKETDGNTHLKHLNLSLAHLSHHSVSVCPVFGIGIRVTVVETGTGGGVLEVGPVHVHPRHSVLSSNSSPLSNCHCLDLTTDFLIKR